MKTPMTLLCLCMFTTTGFAKTVTNSSSLNEQVGYSFGYLMGRSNAESVKDLDLDAFILGLKTAAQGGKSALTDEEMARVLTQHKKQSDAKQLIELKKKADANAKIGAEFLAANAKKQGVQTTQSGLQYQILKPGTGQSPKANSIVKVNYEGRLIDGTVFDASKNHGGSATFQLDQVIPGWTEGVQLMKEGAEYTFYVPSKLAYGERAASEKIGPNSTLIFDVKLVKIEKTPAK